MSHIRIKPRSPLPTSNSSDQISEIANNNNNNSDSHSTVTHPVSSSEKAPSPVILDRERLSLSSSSSSPLSPPQSPRAANNNTHNTHLNNNLHQAQSHHHHHHTHNHHHHTKAQSPTLSIQNLSNQNSPLLLVRQINNPMNINSNPSTNNANPINVAPLKRGSSFSEKSGKPSISILESFPNCSVKGCKKEARNAGLCDFHSRSNGSLVIAPKHPHKRNNNNNGNNNNNNNNNGNSNNTNNGVRSPRATDNDNNNNNNNNINNNNNNNFNYNSYNNNDNNMLAPDSDMDNCVMNVSSILHITELVSSNVPTEAMIMRILEAAFQLVPSMAVSLFILDEASNYLTCRASKTVSETYNVNNYINYGNNLSGVNGPRIRLDLVGPSLGIIGTVVRTGRNLNVTDASRDWRYNELMDSRVNIGIKEVNQVLCIAIRNDQGRTIGALECINSLRNTNNGSTNNKYSSADETLLKALSCCVSAVLGKEEAIQKLAVEKHQIDALHLIASLTGTELGIYRVIQKIVIAANMVVPSERCRIYLVSDDNKQLCYYHNNIDKQEKENLSISVNSSSNNNVNNGNDYTAHYSPLDDTVAGAVAQTGNPINITDCSTDPRYQNTNKEDSINNYPAARSMLCIPIREHLGRTIAVLEVINRLPATNPSYFNSGSNGSGSSNGSSNNFGMNNTNSNKDVLPPCIPFSDSDKQLLSSLASTAANVLRQAQLYEEALAHRRQTDALLEITQLLSTEIGNSTAMVVPRIIEAAYRLVGAERVSLFSITDPLERLYDPNLLVNVQKQASGGSSESHNNDKNVSICGKAQCTGCELCKHGPSLVGELVCIVSKDEKMLGRRIKLGSGLVGNVALTLQSLNIADVATDGRFNNETDRATQFVTRSILTVPIVDGDRRGVAVLQAVNKKIAGTSKFGAPFTSEDVKILENLAVIAGITLRKSKMYHAVESAEKKSRALLSLLSLDQDASLPAVMDSISKVAYEALDADRVSIFFCDHQKSELFSIVSKDVKALKFPMSKGIVGNVALTGIPVNVRDCYADDRFDPTYDQRTGYTTRSMLCLPVRDTNGIVLAVVQALNKRQVSVTRASQLSMGLSMRIDRRRGSFNNNKPGTLNVAPGVLPTSNNSEIYSYFTQEDEDLGAAICSQIRATIRKCRTDAIMMKFKPGDAQAASLIDLYSEQNKHDNFPLQSALTMGRRPSKQAFVFPKQVKKAASKLQSVEFDVFQYSDDELMGFVLCIFQEEMGLLGFFELKIETLKNFILAVRKKYHSHPFHNWKHGVSTLHYAYLTVRQTKRVVGDILEALDVLGLLVASLCHDLDHPGRTNAFEINSSSELALIYNDQSVLEHHHCSTTFHLLKETQNNIFAELEPIDVRELRKIIISGILCTDMTQHFEQCKKLSSLESLVSLSPSNDKDRQLVVQCFIHSADLSGQVYPISVAKEWERRIALEFQAQKEEEEKLGMPVAPFMEGLDDLKQRAKLQVSFIDFVLLPWWSEMARLFSLPDALAQLLANRSHYNRIQTEGFDESLSSDSASLANLNNDNNNNNNNNYNNNYNNKGNNSHENDNNSSDNNNINNSSNNSTPNNESQTYNILPERSLQK